MSNEQERARCAAAWQAFLPVTLPQLAWQHSGKRARHCCRAALEVSPNKQNRVRTEPNSGKNPAEPKLTLCSWRIQVIVQAGGWHGRETGKS